MMTGIKLTNVNKSFGSVRVLHDINLDIEKGEFIVFVGPSGCGKSTLLRLLAGLESISSGKLEIDGKLMNDVPASMRGIAMVFQNYALYPHMSVFDNIGFSLKMADVPEAEINAAVTEVAEMLQLSPYLDRLPKALSGGQRQRVAIGRTLVRKPNVFLFDEPLSNLDAKLRVAMRMEIANINRSLPDATMIYVTHDQVEAMTLADRIVVLSSDGGIEQVGTPLELYVHPNNLFVAGFIGSPAMNIVPATVVQTGVSTWIEVQGAGKWSVSIETTDNVLGDSSYFGVRPEDLIITDSEEWIIEATISYIEELGDQSLLYLHIGADKHLLVVKVPGMVEHRVGDSIRLNADAQKRHLFDKDGNNFSRITSTSEIAENQVLPIQGVEIENLG